MNKGAIRKRTIRGLREIIEKKDVIINAQIKIIEQLKKRNDDLAAIATLKIVVAMVVIILICY